MFGKGSPWCRNLDNPNPHGVDEKYAARFQCNSDQYNELASLTLKPLAVSIASLFHQKSMHTFSAPALAYFFAYTSVWTCVTYGLHVPSGLFIPSILCGATVGRLIAVLIFPVLFPHDTMQNLGQQAAIYMRFTFSRRLQDAISCYCWRYGRASCHYSHDGRSCSLLKWSSKGNFHPCALFRYQSWQYSPQQSSTVRTSSLSSSHASRPSWPATYSMKAFTMYIFMSMPTNTCEFGLSLIVLIAPPRAKSESRVQGR